MGMLWYPTSERIFIMYEALRKGASIQELYERTHIKPWFIEQMKELVDLEEKILTYKGRLLPDDLLTKAKKDGFADGYLAKLLGIAEEKIRNQRTRLGITETWEPVPVSGVENAAYYYSTYNAPDKVQVSGRKKVMVLGGGPNRIGQGIEFDYCCVHAAFALRDLGYETIMVNCNPETVSTDYDTSDKLYFEPLTVEDVLSIYQKEKPEGVIVQFGGQTPLNICRELERAGVKILGTSPDTIDLAEDRDRFRIMMKKLEIPQPASGMAHNLDEAIAIAERIGYPLMVRPSYVLGGRGMEVVHDEEDLTLYVSSAVEIWPELPILIDKFLENALEVEADAISDGSDAFIPAIMEHIELAGIHSGDSACVLPPVSIPEKHRKTIEEYTQQDCHRAQGPGPDQHSIRDCRRQGLHPRSQSSSFAHGSAGIQGLQHPDGSSGHPADAGQKNGRPEPHAKKPSRTTESKKRFSHSTCSMKSIRSSDPKCAPREKSWAWPIPSNWRFTKLRKRPSSFCPSRAPC